MTNNSDIKTVPAEGQAWLGDWETRLRTRLGALGFTSIADFAAAHPTWGIDHMAEHLSVDEQRRINLADVAAIQVAELWLKQAEAAGSAAVESMARRILIGELAESLPEGFPEWQTAIAEYRNNDDIESPVWKLQECISALRDCMGDGHRPQCDRVFESLIERAELGTIPVGWQPTDPADPILDAVFQEGWNHAGEIR